ncbi:MAG: ribose-phosphate diphosphokinase [Holosporaceae bacterium]|jgi:ribose-phosphate pyrophosphokinase|nr:ribose-phosphate diphosphokinase [Holosporaceae bacterium]
MEVVHTKNSQKLAESMARELSLSVFPANFRYFNGQEAVVSLPKRFREVLVVASTATNEDWLELFLLLDALRGTKNLILCMPHMGYSRQDVLNQNESFGARLFCRLLETFSISHCIILDNHCEPRLQIPYTHLNANRIFEEDMEKKYDPQLLAVVSPDVGGARRAIAISRTLKCEFVLCHKTRNVFGELKKVEILGNVARKTCILVDDVVDSGATLCQAAEMLRTAGCGEIAAYVVHGVLSSGSLERLEKSCLTELVLTDSIHNESIRSNKIRKLSVASLMAEAIGCIL